MEIKEIYSSTDKQQITRQIMESLSDWFGIPEAREYYIQESGKQPFCVAFDEEKPVGFAYLKETGKDTTEISVVGVLKEYHRKGIGRKLIEKIQQIAKQKGYSFIQVKTVQMGKYDDYDDTNRFYQALGFKEFEVFPMLWDENNPCQIYVMYIGE